MVKITPPQVLITAKKIRTPRKISHPRIPGGFPTPKCYMENSDHECAPVLTHLRSTFHAETSHLLCFANPLLFLLLHRVRISMTFSPLINDVYFLNDP